MPRFGCPSSCFKAPERPSPFPTQAEAGVEAAGPKCLPSSPPTCADHFCCSSGPWHQRHFSASPCRCCCSAQGKVHAARISDCSSVHVAVTWKPARTQPGAAVQELTELFGKSLRSLMFQDREHNIHHGPWGLQTSCVLHAHQRATSSSDAWSGSN